MTHIAKSVNINCSVHDAWRVYADYGGVAAWHPYMEDAFLDPGPATGVGASRTAVFGPKMEIREVVTEWVPDDHMLITIEFLKGLAPPITNIVAGVFVEGDSESSKVTLTMDYDTKWGPLGTIADTLMIKRQYRQVFDHMLAATKLFAETGDAPTPIAMPGSGRKV